VVVLRTTTPFFITQEWRPKPATLALPQANIFPPKKREVLV